MRYEKMVNEMTQITSAILDMEGGRWLLAIMYELPEDLLAIEDYVGCYITIQKLALLLKADGLRTVSICWEISTVRSLPETRPYMATTSSPGTGSLIARVWILDTIIWRTTGEPSRTSRFAPA